TMTAPTNSRARASRGWKIKWRRRAGIPDIVSARFLGTRDSGLTVCCGVVRLACRCFRTQISDDALCDGRGISGPPVGALHRSGLVGIPHVAQLDQYRWVLGQIQAGEVCAAVEAVRSDVRGL